MSAPKPTVLRVIRGVTGCQRRDAQEMQLDADAAVSKKVASAPVGTHQTNTRCPIATLPEELRREIVKHHVLKDDPIKLIKYGDLLTFHEHGHCMNIRHKYLKVKTCEDRKGEAGHAECGKLSTCKGYDGPLVLECKDAFGEYVRHIQPERTVLELAAVSKGYAAVVQEIFFGQNTFQFANVYHLTKFSSHCSARAKLIRKMMIRFSSPDPNTRWSTALEKYGALQSLRVIMLWYEADIKKAGGLLKARGMKDFLTYVKTSGLKNLRISGVDNLGDNGHRKQVSVNHREAIGPYIRAQLPRSRRG